MGKTTYLGRHQLLDAAAWDGIPLAAVTLVPDGTFRSYEKGSQIAWFLGAVLFAAGHAGGGNGAVPPIHKAHQ